MQKLSKADIARLAELEVRIRDSYTDLQAKHEKLVEEIAALNSDIDAHNAIIVEAQGVRDDLVGEMDSFASDKSEKWQESDKGQAYEAWKSEWENLDLEELEHVEVPDLPDSSAAEALEQAPQEPEA